MRQSTIRAGQVEALYLIGSGLTGTGSNDADTLYSSGGPNTLVGLGGDDLYYVNNTADVVIEAANGGIDTVIATSNYTMPANVEGLYMLGAGLTGTGRAAPTRCSAAAAPTRWSGLAATISIASTTVPTW